MKWRGLDEKQNVDAGTTLAARLDERRVLMEKYVSAETQALNRRAVEELQASGIEARVLPVGGVAPGFELPDQDGKIVGYALTSANIGQMWGTALSGPLIILFFRGRWCPFDVAQLEAWNELLPIAGVSVIGISPQTQHQSYLMHEQHKLKFPLLSDAGNKVARQFGLVYRVPAYQQEIYSRTFVNLPFINGNDSWELPVPATYGIDREGRVVLAAANADYTRRVEPATAIMAVVPGAY
ncbi:MAG: peroxiredoxin-like family protein [Terriglobales bacterium]